MILKILIVGNYIHNEQQSMLHFAELIKTLLIREGHEVILLQPTPIFGNLKPSDKGLGKWLGYIDRFILFRLTLKRMAKKVDIVHVCDHSNAMYAKWLGETPHVVTCHDLMAIRSALGAVAVNKTGWSGRLLQKWIVKGLESSQHIVCVSHQTEKELLMVTDVESSRTSVVYNALNYPYQLMDVVESEQYLIALFGDTTSPFFLHIGGNQWYKNRIGVVRLFNYLTNYEQYAEHKLVLAGQSWSDELKEAVQKSDVSDQIIEFTNLSNEELRALYSRSEALLFPSLQEGFGWPIVEGQACGTPVVTTNKAPMTEVGGDAAIYIDPENEELASKIIVEALKDREQIIQAGLINVKRFAQERMSEGYINAYKLVLKGYKK